MSHIKPKKAISRKELEEGTTIEVDDIVNSSSDEDCFDDDMCNNFISEMEKLSTGEYVEDESKSDLSKLSVSELKEKMEPLTDDKQVLKLVVQYGVGSVIPSKSIILMHYTACLENVDVPFDSTYTRGRPHRFLLNAGYVIPGLDIAVSSMRKGEIAKIWIHSDYAYGQMGCPPRIPSSSNILYTVEILNFIDSKDAIEFEEMTPEDQKKASFEKVFSVSRIEHELGNDMCKNKKYPAAIARYQKARRLLEEVSVADENEDQRRIHRLFKLYLNLSLCFLKLKNPKRVIFFSRKALDIDGNNTKALYRMGEAYLLQNEFDMAKKYLLQAKHQEPYNPEINKALLDFEEKCRKFNAWDKQFCQKMFKFSSEDVSEDSSGDKKKLPESPEFIKIITDCITKFKNSDDKEYKFSSGYTPNQIDVIRSITKSHGLYFMEKIYDTQKIIKIMKSR